MEKKALFLDLDGTLLNDQKEITPKNREAISQALEQGHTVVITTGRPLVSAIKQAVSLGLTGEGCYLIAFNGSTIYDMGRKEIVFQRTIPLELVRKVFAEANRLGLHIQTYDDTDVLVEPRNDDDAVRRYCSLIKVDFRVIPDVSELTQEPVKMLVIDYHHKTALERFRQWIYSWAEGQLDSFFSCEQYLEVVTTGLSKGTALKQLCEILDIPLTNSCAAGDAANDIPMIQAAHIGVAMANAIEEVKAISNYITTNDNNHDGIAEIIERFILN